MDFPVQRRKINTYGKSQRKVLVHDIFDVASSNAFPSSQSAVTQFSSSSSSTTPAERLSTTSKPALATGKSIPQPSTVKHGTASSLSMKPSSDSASISSRSSSFSPVDQTDASLFDIQSSDEEGNLGTQHALAVKRRKVVPLQSKKSTSRAGKSATHSSDNNKPTHASKGMQRIDVSQRTASSRADLHKIAMTSKRQPPKTTIAKAPVNKPAAVPSGLNLFDQISEDSSSSRLSRPTTPKRKRPPSTLNPVNAPSPSDLQLTALSLTPEAHLSLSEQISADEDMTDDSSVSPTPRKPRRRLIDRLDPPRLAKSEPITLSNTPDSSSIIDDSMPTVHNLDKLSPPRSLPVEGSSSQPIPNGVGAGPKSGRIRSTYARQRSHLSDTMDGLENPQISHSQRSSQRDLSHATSFTSVASQLELDQDDIDETDLPAQKSIHELRRGGAISRFDNDLLELLGDIQSSSKALRIPALMQLAGKLSDLAFLLQFQESDNVSRVTDSARPDLDDVSSTLMILVFQIMTSAHHVSPRTLPQILDAICRLPPYLATSNQSLTKLAKDRSQNLSKLLVREICDFDDKRSAAMNLAASSTGHLYLVTLENTVRRMRQLGDAPALPQSILRELVSVISTSWDVLRRGPTEEHVVESMRTCFSILEIVSLNPDLSRLLATTKFLTQLRDATAGIVQWAGEDHPHIAQVCLKFIISLSNDRSDVCNALSEGGLIGTMYTIVEDHFIRLAMSIPSESDPASQRLDTVILALGCLLNFAASSDRPRQRMLELSDNGRSLVEGMVEVFNSCFERASEATTIEHTHLVVPLGYLSMLLCALCLNANARDLIVRTTRGQGLSDLFLAVETFLKSWRQVEAETGETDETSSGFSRMLTDIYDAVRMQSL
ncbi:hypothetical protein PV10_05541 [Exophiala mesophila]|uniref:Wings apart-like protein C-terminal domain-containing protein n=1 Tax=Exophiala mesophila TaxID=212818 RepID=A0A0D1XS51_EXOME|nr:uncharacterized protein PV10_05541 [Exophiala mesophila]KIV90941.1 hypothetical protein PV10_05541 [Exophiala mesophila]